MRIRDWYFQGWERREDENGRRVFVYTGEYYAFPGGLRAARRTTGLLSAALILVYLLAALTPPEGGMWHLAAIPQLLELIPLVYLGMGVVCLLRAREPLTYRAWHASWRRMHRASLASLVFTAAMAVVEIVFLVLASPASVGAELLYLMEELTCAALSLGILLYIQKHPCSQSVVPTDKE